jgi:hypothetical protein
MKKIYISSTYQDLKDHRAAVTHALRKMGYLVVCMEEYAATDERTDVHCQEDVATCDFYVGIIAKRYGWIPPGKDLSITQLEYQQARKQQDKTRCLVFVLDEEANWPLKWVDGLEPGSQGPAEKLRAFRQSLEGHSTATFDSVNSLVQGVMAAVRREETVTWQLALKQEFEEILKHCKATPVGAPETLATDAYKLYLGSSYLPMITQGLQAAINNAHTAKLVDVDLVGQGGWWSTRLHLLSGLLAHYTRVEKIVFLAGTKCIGTCGPADVRRALAEKMPRIEMALAESLVDRPGLDPALEIPEVVARFSSKLDALGGEAALRWTTPPELVDITPNIARNFPRFNDDRVTVQPNQDDIHLLPKIICKPYSYVPLERTDGDFIVIDRVLLATRIAELATRGI